MIVPELFAHAEIRPSQDQMIQDFSQAIEQKRILLAHAPTGLGKTASALSAAVSSAMQLNKKVLFLTNRHTQHNIAIHTLQLMAKKSGKKISTADLIGKRWMCNQEIAGLFDNEFNEFCRTIVEIGECEFYNNVFQKKAITVEAKKNLHELKERGPLHNEDVIAHCRTEKACSYEMSLLLAKNAQVIVGDYYYLFNPHVQSTMLNKLDLAMEDIILIVDEGHNLPGRVTEMLSSVLTTNMLKNGITEAKKQGYGGVIQWLQDLSVIFQQLNDGNTGEAGNESLVSKDSFIKKVEQKVPYDQLVGELELAADEIRKRQRKSYLGGIASFLAQWQGPNQGFARILSEKDTNYGHVISLSYSCLDPSLITRDVFAQVYAGIIMSGTLKPTSMYRELLGIDNGITKEYSSPFPPENKLTLIVPETSTKFTLRGMEMYQKIAKMAAEMSSYIPGNVALFFPSYSMRDQVANFIKTTKKLFWEKSEMSKEEKESFIAGFKECKDGLLLGVTGANFAEGVDFPGDLLNGVIVIGLPLGKPDLKTKETIKYYDEKYKKGWDYGYIFPAMSKCIQSAGRCIRSETDRGVIIYLDERFAWQRYYDCFPDRVGLMVTKEYEQKIKNFF